MTKKPSFRKCSFLICVLLIYIITSINIFALTFKEDSQDTSWILIELPPEATQIQYGAEVYRLVCEACHGNVGQGLTDDWRSTWGPNDQNCWQSKCHASNYTIGGFEMTRRAPKIVGADVLFKFETAQDLYIYIKQFMPWQDPGSLIDKDAWAVTAYVLKLNGITVNYSLNPFSSIFLKLNKPAGF